MNLDQPTRGRMLGNSEPSWCPYCHAPPGPDCPDKGRARRAVKRRENRRWQNAAGLAMQEADVA